MRRWLLAILIIIAALLIAGVVAVQVVLTTDVPRRMVLDALEEQTGLRFGATSLETGWRGRTVLRGLTVALPLEADPFVHVPELRITHADLVRLVVFRDLNLQAAELDRPFIQLRQDAQGQWNALEAVYVFEQRQAALGVEPGELPPLPKLTIDDAEIEVTAGNRRRVFTYGPLDFRGEPEDALSWHFALALDRDVLARGRLAPRANWAHRIEFDFQDIHGLVAPWLDEPPPILQAAGEWRGQLNDAALAGTLRLDPLRFGEMTAHGETGISVLRDTVTVEPRDLTLAMREDDAAPIHVRGGAIHADARSTRINRLVVHGYGASAQIDGAWEPQQETAWANIKWSGDVREFDAQHEGTIAARLDMPRVGSHVLTADVRAHARSPDAEVDAQWQITGRGEHWRSVAGGITTPRLVIHAEDRAIDLSGMAARFRSTWPEIQLTRLDLPGAEAGARAPGTISRGRGRFDADTGEWFINVAAEQWRVPGLHDIVDAPLDVRIQVTGDPSRINLDVLRIAREDLELSAAGVYVMGGSQPLDLRARLDGRMNENALAAKIDADLAVTGFVQPLNLSVSGRLDATDIAWEGRRLEDMAVPVRGTIEPRRASFESAEVSALGGTWRLAGEYDHRWNTATASLDGQAAAVERIVHLLGAPFDVEGLVDAEVNVRLPDMNLALLQLDGSWQARELHGHGLLAARGRGRVDYGQNLVRLYDMHLEDNGGEMTGVAELDLRRIRHLLVDVSARHWPTVFPEHGIELLVSGDAALDVDVIDLIAHGSMAMGFDVTLDGRAVGHMDVEAAIDGRTVNLASFWGQVLDGRIEGTGQLHLTEADWTQSWLHATWAGIDLARWRETSKRRNVETSATTHDGAHGELGESNGKQRASALLAVSALNRFDVSTFRDFDVSGIASGTLTVNPSDDPRAPEPVRIDLAVQLDDAWYGPVALGPMELTGYLGPKRFMIERARYEAIGGVIGMWGRLTRHNGDWFTHVHLDVEEIDLQQVADFLAFTEDPTPGRISGSGSAGGYVAAPHRLFGHANMQLTASDIANVPGIAQLYSLLNVDFARVEPTGRGEVLVRLEGDALELSRVSYFNRGVDIVGRLRLENLWAAADSPIDGIAAGTIRPLRELELPLIGDNLDRLIGAIQTGAASVRIGGTLVEPDVAAVPLPEVLGALRRIVRGVR